MINTKIDSLNNTPVYDRKTAEAGAVNKSALSAAAETSNAETSAANKDTFEHSVPNEKVTYSPADIGQSESAGSAASVTSANNTASTDTQRRNIPYSLAAKMAHLRTDSSGMPIINGANDYRSYQNALSTIQGDHETMWYDSDYCYSQTGYNYGYTNATRSCATFALATALSIMNNEQITPDQISTYSSTDGTGTKWLNHGTYHYNADEEETLLAIDAQLELGNPVLINTDGYDSRNNYTYHWATVIGKENDEYIIIDPWDGTERSLDDMEIYKKGGSIIGYTILTNEY